MQELRREGHEVGRYKVRALMREAGLKCRQRRPHRYRSSGTEPLTDDRHQTIAVSPFIDFPAISVVMRML